MKTFYVDSLRVQIFPDRRTMGRRSGEDAAECLRQLLREKETVNIMFGAAPSQNEMLETLCQSDVDWTRVNAFHMDEYLGLPADHPASFGNFLRRAIFDHLPFRAVYFIDGSGRDVPHAIREYEALLRSHPLDVCMLGVGENGHLAFNDPPADFRDPALLKTVTLEETCRLQQVHDGCFSALDQVPRQALTVTVPGLCSAGRMLCTVPAVTKAEAVRAMLEEPVSPACPASILRRYDNAALYLDADAASRLSPDLFR